MKRDPAKPTGGGSPPAYRAVGSDHRTPGKNSVEKKAQSGLPSGAPEIAHPDDPKRYERQIAFVTAWFLEMWVRIRINDAEPGQPGTEARAELQTLLINTIGQVLGVALGEEDGLANKWASELLAIIGVSFGKHDQHNEKLRANSAYVEMKKKLSGKALTSALFPTYVCGIAQQELETAEKCRWSLLLSREGCCDGWAMEARWQGILEEYWPTVEFPEFSVKNESTWWEFLRPLIKKKIDLSKMAPLKLREYDMVKVSMRKGRNPEVRDSARQNRKRYPSDSETTAHDHLKLLARLRDAGMF